MIVVQKNRLSSPAVFVIACSETSMLDGEFNIFIPLNMKSPDNTKLLQKGKFQMLLTFAAWGSLVAAYIFGSFILQEDYAMLAEEQVVERDYEVTGSGINEMTIMHLNSRAEIKVVFGKSQGYGGDLIVGVLYDSVGIITDILILVNRETPSFVDKLDKKGFFRQFPGKAVNEPFQLETDVDAISGSTISSAAFTNAIRSASFQAAREDFDLEVKEPPVQWKVGFDEMAILVLIVIGILAIYLKKKWLRYVSLGVSLVIVGFYLNASVSISHFAKLILGFLPGLKEHLIWWGLISVALVFPFFLRKNLYCYALCPFYAVQTILIKITGSKLKLTDRFLKFAKTASKVLLWMAFMVIFISANPTLGSFEPFAYLFSLDGAGLQWYLLPAALIGAVFVPDYYCRYFCPVGRALQMIKRFGNKILGKIHMSGSVQNHWKKQDIKKRPKKDIMKWFVRLVYLAGLALVITYLLFGLLTVR
jgi:Na+-translocating ferredoxin:NAD+ oxidoreductase RnfG subunit